MDPWRSIVWPAALPFALTLVCLLPSAALRGRRWEEGAAARRVPLSAGLGVAGGYVAASWLMLGPPQWPAVSADERLLWVVAAAALLAGLWGLARPVVVPGLVGFLGLLGLSALGSWWILERSFAHIYPGRQGWLAFGAVCALLLGTTWLLGALARRRPGFSTPALLVAVAAATAGVLVLGRTAKLAQLSGALASALAACALVALWRRQLVIAGGATATCAFVLVGLLGIGVVYNEVPAGAALLVLVALLAPALMELPGPRSLASGPHAAARLLLVLPALAGALYLAWQARPPAYDY